MPMRRIFVDCGDKFSIDDEGNLMMSNRDGETSLIMNTEIEDFANWLNYEIADRKAKASKPGARP